MARPRKPKKQLLWAVQVHVPWDDSWATVKRHAGVEEAVADKVEREKRVTDRNTLRVTMLDPEEE